MTENNRKRCRKDKLVPRDCVEFGEDDSDLQEPSQKKKLVLAKIKKEPEDYTPQNPPAHQFSVEVEIEGMDSSLPDEDAPDYMKYLFSLSKESPETEEPSQDLDYADNSLLIEQKLVIPLTEEEKYNSIDVKQVQKLLGTLHKKFPKEREAVWHCRNQWGNAFNERCPVEFKKTPHELLLHNVLARWKQWAIALRCKDSPLCYKCYICNNGWWTLTEFANHIKTHPDIKLQIQTRNIECDIVAYQGDTPKFKDIDIHGKCTKCAKTYHHHLTNKRSSDDAYYYCNYCEERFQTCRNVNKHEGSCARNPIRVLAISRAGKEYSFSDFSCKVCQTLFLSNPDLEEHMVICHKVRSDEPIVTTFKTCKDCEQNYYNFFSHVCPKKNFAAQCPHCSRKFQNKAMAEHHVKMWDKAVQCRICEKFLPKGCMAGEHYALHSAEFMFLHRCLICRKIKVYVSEDKLKMHCNRYHKRYDARRPKSDRIILPRSMLQQCFSGQAKKVAVAAKPARPKAAVKLTRGETIPQVRVYAPTQKNNTLASKVESDNTTIAHDDTVSMRPEDAPVETTPVTIKQEKEDVCEDMPVPENIPEDTTAPEIMTENATVPEKIPENTVVPEKIPDNAAVPEKMTVNTAVPEIIPEISVKNIKVEKMDIDEEIISEVGQSAKNDEVKEKEDRKDIINIMEELTEFLDIKPDIIKEEKFSDDEASQATKELTNLLQMSDTGESDISKVFKASSAFAEEVTNNSEHSKVYQISKTILDTIVKEEVTDEPEESIEDPIDIDTTKNSTKDSPSESSDLSLLNLEPEVILKAGYRKRKIYKCNKCNYSGYHREYKDHINNHTNTHVPKEFVADVIYKCTKCDTKFPSQKKYALHFEKHGYPYMSCPYCCQQFESVTKLMPHLNAHIKNYFIKVQLIDSCEDKSIKVYECKKCKETLGSDKWFEHWESHLELTGPPEKPKERFKVGEKGEHALNETSLKEVLAILTKQFTNDSIYAKACVVCSRVFDRKNDTKRHLIEHLLEDAVANIVGYSFLKCQICQELHKKPDSYKKHMRDHANLPIYKCGLCNKTFSDSSNFTKHKKIHNLKAFICDICSKKFQAKLSLEKHIQMHMQTGPITCTRCPMVFHDRSFYRRHYRQHHDKLLTKYRCMLCREKFATLRAKWDHLWNIHKQRKEQADCPICGVSYRKFIDVKRHAMEVHGKSITLSSLWSLLNQIKVQGRQETAGAGGSKVKEEVVSSDDDCLLIEEERETLVVYD